MGTLSIRPVYVSLSRRIIDSYLQRFCSSARATGRRLSATRAVKVSGLPGPKHPHRRARGCSKQHQPANQPTNQPGSVQASQETLDSDRCSSSALLRAQVARTSTIESENLTAAFGFGCSAKRCQIHEGYLVPKDLYLFSLYEPYAPAVFRQLCTELPLRCCTGQSEQLVPIASVWAEKLLPCVSGYCQGGRVGVAPDAMLLTW